VVTATAAGDITVNLEGLWLLQSLTGVSRVAAELRGRPYGQSASMQWVTEHPGLHTLVAEGICDEAGAVRADVAARLRVLGTPDVEVVILVSKGPLTWSTAMTMDDPATWRAIPPGQLRIVLARREGRWVSAVRADSHITIDDCAVVDADWLSRVACDALDAVHPSEPARITAVNVPLTGMCAAAAQADQAEAGLSLTAKLKAVGFSGPALPQLTEALKEPLAEAVLYARAYVDGVIAAGESVLNLRDTNSGRLALYRVNPPRGTQQEWMAVGPANAGQVRQGASSALDSVPVSSWNSHERMG